MLNDSGNVGSNLCNVGLGGEGLMFLFQYLHIHVWSQSCVFYGTPSICVCVCVCVCVHLYMSGDVAKIIDFVNDQQLFTSVAVRYWSELSKSGRPNSVSDRGENSHQNQQKESKQHLKWTARSSGEICHIDWQELPIAMPQSSGSKVQPLFGSYHQQLCVC